MNGVWFAVLCLFVIAGCSDRAAEENAKKAALYDSMQKVAGKQQKLEDCMSQADLNFRNFRNLEWGKIGCGKYGANLPDDVIVSCNGITDYAKQIRLEDEERCIKLYK